ncbi:MAG: GtrA family protein [Desulfovibrionaceae bacterium]|nr:GtrA family protein [Desulfovibrionaceae bacterium]
MMQNLAWRILSCGIFPLQAIRDGINNPAALCLTSTLESAIYLYILQSGKNIFYLGEKALMVPVKNKMALKQSLKFFAVSGCGWLIDFSVFTLLAQFVGFNVAYANMLSSIPAITLVFFVSTRKIFANKKNGMSIWKKYIIYFFYQIILVICISWVGEGFYRLLLYINIEQILPVSGNIKLICKIIITPIAMTMNFMMMKILCERL